MSAKFFTQVITRLADKYVTQTLVKVSEGPCARCVTRHLAGSQRRSASCSRCRGCRCHRVRRCVPACPRGCRRRTAPPPGPDSAPPRPATAQPGLGPSHPHPRHAAPPQNKKFQAFALRTVDSVKPKNFEKTVEALKDGKLPDLGLGKGDAAAKAASAAPAQPPGFFAHLLNEVSKDLGGGTEDLAKVEARKAAAQRAQAKVAEEKVAKLEAAAEADAADAEQAAADAKSRRAAAERAASASATSAAAAGDKLEVAKMSVKELRALLDKHKIGYADCFDKSDLVDRAKGLPGTR